MKKAILLVAAIIFVASSVSAQLPPVGYIGIFKDATHNTDPGANVICPAPYSQFQAWIWILPPATGMQAAEWAVLFPATTVTLLTTQHPNISVALGTMATGISVAFAEGACNMEWVWTHQLQMMSLGAAPCKIEIIKHPTTQPPAHQAATCELGYPIVPLINLTPLYLCMDGSVGVQETNWGAIKSLF